MNWSFFAGWWAGYAWELIGAWLVSAWMRHREKRARDRELLLRAREVLERNPWLADGAGKEQSK